MLEAREGYLIFGIPNRELSDMFDLLKLLHEEYQEKFNKQGLFFTELFELFSHICEKYYLYSHTIQDLVVKDGNYIKDPHAIIDCLSALLLQENFIEKDDIERVERLYASALFYKGILDYPEFGAKFSNAINALNNAILCFIEDAQESLTESRSIMLLRVPALMEKVKDFIQNYALPLASSIRETLIIRKEDGNAEVEARTDPKLASQLGKIDGFISFVKQTPSYQSADRAYNHLVSIFVTPEGNLTSFADFIARNEEQRSAAVTTLAQAGLPEFGINDSDIETAKLVIEKLETPRDGLNRLTVAISRLQAMSSKTDIAEPHHITGLGEIESVLKIIDPDNVYRAWGEAAQTAIKNLGIATGKSFWQSVR